MRAALQTKICEAKGAAQRNLEIAKSMKSNNIDVVLIAKCTGLPVYEIKQL